MKRYWIARYFNNDVKGIEASSQEEAMYKAKLNGRSMLVSLDEVEDEDDNVYDEDEQLYLERAEE